MCVCVCVCDLSELSAAKLGFERIQPVQLFSAENSGTLGTYFVCFFKKRPRKMFTKQG